MNIGDKVKRDKKIIKVGVIGIITNLLLVIIKEIIGFISCSFSLIMDGINNLSDALSAIITIIGMHLASKEPDKEHPYGHGKIEYITSSIIATIILITGVLAFYESIKRIIDPVKANYTKEMLVLITLGVFVKYFLGTYVQKKGKELNSDSLVAAGLDALFDAIIATSTLIGALISYLLNISIEGYLGIFISFMIIKSGYEIIKRSFDLIIGTRINPELIKKIKESINKNKKVLGTYDLILHEYGPEKLIGSIHIEVDDTLTAKEIHKLTREISEEIYDKYQVILTIGIYASNITDNEYKEIKKELKKILKNYPHVSELHGYYIDTDTNTISFDLIFDFKEKDCLNCKEEIIEKIKEKYPNYNYNIIIDNNFNE